MDLVGVLGLPQLLREAQGLLVRRDPALGHVPLALLRLLGTRHVEAAPRVALTGIFSSAAARVRRGPGPFHGAARHPRDPARGRDHGGEPLVRLLLRHLSARRRDPDEARRADRVRAERRRPVREAVPRPERRRRLGRRARPARRQAGRRRRPHGRLRPRHRPRADPRVPPSPAQLGLRRTSATRTS